MTKETKNVYVRVRLKVDPAMEVDTLMKNLCFKDDKNQTIDADILSYGHRTQRPQTIDSAE
jgi:hypothetical protein